MDITVIVCTYNRSHSLARALASVAAQELPDSIAWEVLIVDNNSHDSTPAVAEQFCRQYPGRFRYQFEPKQGKSFALNAAIASARGAILAFVDDDVVADTKWLARLTSPLSDPSYAGAGGRILPDWKSTPPKWIPRGGRYDLAPLAAFDLGPDPGPLLEAPFGTNMAFRRTVFARHGGFRTDLGPRPGSEVRNEDTEFGWRVLAAGERLRYEPSALVYHEVPQHRLRKRYFLRWWFDKARAEVLQNEGTQPRGWLIAGVPVRLLLRLSRWTVSWLVTLEPSARFSCKIKAWGAVGEIIERCRHARYGKKAVGADAI